MLEYLRQFDFPLMVIPLKTFVLQGLLLIVTIAIEARVIESKLGVSPRGSVQFSTLLNLVSTIGGWFCFLGIEVFLPESGRLEVMNYIFFNDWSRINISQVVYLGIPIVIGIYVLTFILESQILNLLLLLLATKPKLQYETSQVQYDRQQRYKASWTDRFRLNTLLVANAYSYIAITALLFITHAMTQVG